MNRAPSNPIRLLLAVAALGLSGAALAQREQPIEPIDLPPSVEQGVDMIYIDPEIAPKLRENDVALHQISFEEWAGAPYDCSCRSTRSTPISAAAWSATSSAGATFPRSKSRPGRP